jgi:tetratricopeptide (TPR) repeat protein
MLNPSMVAKPRPLAHNLSFARATPWSRGTKHPLDAVLSEKTFFADMDPTPTEKKSASEFVRSTWFGFAEIRRQSGGQRRIRLRWWRLMVAGLGGFVVFYLLLALAGYFWFKSWRGFADERYTDMLTLPFHFAEHNRKMGEYFIQIGNDHAKNGRPDLAMQDYRIGLMKAPDDLPARANLSFYYTWRYPDRPQVGLDVLTEGLPYAIAQKKPEFINNFFQYAEQHHFADVAIATARQYLAQKDLSPEVRRVFALHLMSIQIEQGDFDPAEETFAQEKLGDGLDGVVLYSQLLWERGRKHAAVNYLLDAGKKYPENQYIYGLLSRYYRDLGDLDKASQYIVLRAVNNSNSVQPRIEMLYILAKSGDKDRLATETQKIIRDFGNDQNSMVMLSDFATNQGDVLLSRQLFNLAQNAKFDITPFCLLTIQAFLTAKDYDSAVAFTNSIGKLITDYENKQKITGGIDQDPAPWYVHYKPVIDALRAVAYYGNGQDELADVDLLSLIKDNAAFPEMVNAVAGRFYGLGGYTEAQRLLQIAHHNDPFSQTVLTQLVTVELQLANSTDLADNLHALLKTQHPNIELLQDAKQELGSDRFIFVPQREVLLGELEQYIDTVANRADSIDD